MSNSKTASTQTRKRPRSSAKVTSKLTKKQQRTVRDFVTEASRRLRLGEWTFEVLFEDPGDDAYATITHTRYSCWATICVGSRFAELGAVQQRQTLVHELAHCYLFDFHETAEDVLDEYAAGEPTLAKTMLRARNEWAVDRVADALLPLVADLPVPADPGT